MIEDLIRDLIDELLENYSEEDQVEKFRELTERLAESFVGMKNETFFDTVNEAVLEIVKEYEYEKEL